MRFIPAYVFSVFCLCMATSAHAEFRVATVDVNRILNASNEAKAAKTSLDAASGKAKKVIDEKKAALKPLEEKAKSGKLDPNSKDAEQLKKQTRDLVSYVRDKEDELRKEFAKSNKSLTEKTMKVVEEYSKDHNIQMVLDKSSTVRSAVLFGEASFDITDEIIKKIND